MSLNLDDLYALRLYYTDTIHDEFQIIKKLKIELFNSGIRDQDQINNTLVEFYQKFNMEWLTKEMIESIQLPQMYSFLDILNMTSNPSTNGINQESTPSNTPNGQENSSETTLTDSDLEDEINTDSDDDSIPELEDDEPDNIINQLFTIPAPNVNQLQINRLNNISINMNAFNMFLTQVLTSQFNPPNMEDVKKYNGIKEEDLNKLKEFNIKEDSEESCCICMMNFDKESKMIELPCGHTFHSFCIKKWFTDSSNTCPICKRNMVKHNIFTMVKKEILRDFSLM